MAADDVWLIEAQFRSALTQIARGEYRRAQFNVDAAQQSLLTKFGTLAESEEMFGTICRERWGSDYFDTPSSSSGTPTTS